MLKIENCPYTKNVPCTKMKEGLCSLHCVYHPFFDCNRNDFPSQDNTCPYTNNGMCKDRSKCSSDCCMHPDYVDEDEEYEGFAEEFNEAYGTGYNQGFKKGYIARLQEEDCADNDIETNEHPLHYKENYCYIRETLTKQHTPMQAFELGYTLGYADGVSDTDDAFFEGKAYGDYQGWKAGYKKGHLAAKLNFTEDELDEFEKFDRARHENHNN